MTDPPGLHTLTGAIVLDGEALASVAALVSWSIRDHRQRGLRLPPHATEIAEATLQAAAEQRTRRRGVAPAPVGPHWLSSAETARRLGITQRSAQRLARSLGARQHRGKWKFPEHAVTEYELLRGRQ